MEICEFKAEHIFQLRLQAAQEMFYAKFSPHYARALEDTGSAWTAMVDGQPIACAGLVEQWQGRALAWALLSGEITPPRFVRITRAVRRALELATFDRIEAHVDAEFGAGLRWAEMLGFEIESKMRRFTPEGRDAFMYVRIKP